MYKMKSVEARKRLVTTYRETKSIQKTAKLWGTSRLVVRKWLKRYKEKGEMENVEIPFYPVPASLVMKGAYP